MKNWIAVFPLAAVLVLVAFLGFHCHPIPTVITAKVDKTQPVQVSPDHVTFTDPVTHKPATLEKPLEGGVTYLPDGTVKIQNIGLTFIPKAGVVYVLGSGLDWYCGARVLFASHWGAEVGGNGLRAFLGLDLRDPVLDLLTTSVGVSSPWGDLLRPSPYLGECATLWL